MYSQDAVVMPLGVPVRPMLFVNIHANSNGQWGVAGQATHIARSAGPAA
jgi:hypothetical protein